MKQRGRRKGPDPCSPGAFGFYPWVDAPKTWWGVVARMPNVSGEQEGVASMLCGRRIRVAWISGQSS